MRRAVPAAGLAFGAACIAGGARADDLFAVRGGSLYRVDTADRTASLIGTVSENRIGAITMLNGELFGIDADTDTLISIDQRTATAATIGRLGYDASFATGLAAVGGRLVGTDDSVQNDGITTNLFEIDSATGGSTLIGDTGAELIVGLSSNRTGQLFGLNGRSGFEELFFISPSTGSGVLIRPQGLLSTPTLGGIAFGQSDRLWTISTPDPAGFDAILLEIDLATGTAASFGTISGFVTSGEVTGLTAVPTPPGAAALAAGGLLASRRRRARTASR